MSKKKNFIVLSVMLTMGTIGYYVLVTDKDTLSPTQQVIFASEQECEQKTHTSCRFHMCDDIPRGKTFAEVCGKNFNKGWIPLVQNAGFALDFFAGGSIFGSSFEVKISGDQIMYRETIPHGEKGIETMNRSLLPNERTEIQKIISDSELITLQSQDFTKEPLAPDQASYRIVVSVNGKKNTIRCGIPPSGTEPTGVCQKHIDTLRLKLNNLLGVHIN